MDQHSCFKKKKKLIKQKVALRESPGCCAPACALRCLAGSTRQRSGDGGVGLLAILPGERPLAGLCGGRGAGCNLDVLLSAPSQQALTSGLCSWAALKLMLVTGRGIPPGLG